MMETITCDVCGSGEYKVIYPAKYDKPSQEFINKFKSSGDEILIDQLVQCKECGLKYLNPRLSREIILKSYSEGSDERFVSQAEYREKTFAKSLVLIEKYANKGKILDVGTAGGTFLNAAKKRGWEVYGCEPNKWLCDWGKKNYNIKIENGDIFSIEYPDNHFDVVTLWDVLEHTNYPSLNLQVAHNMLKKDGILVVNYPDIGSWLSKLMGRKWLFLLSVHLYYFDRKTIRKILEKNGFKVIKIKPHIQKLSLGYLVLRMEKYSKLVYKICKPVVKLLHLDTLQIPYWLGQTLVIAEKKEITQTPKVEL